MICQIVRWLEIKRAAYHVNSGPRIQQPVSQRKVTLRLKLQDIGHTGKKGMKREKERKEPRGEKGKKKTNQANALNVAIDGLEQ
jgi:hypothetical protein